MIVRIACDCGALCSRNSYVGNGMQISIQDERIVCGVRSETPLRRWYRTECLEYKQVTVECTAIRRIAPETFAKSYNTHRRVSNTTPPHRLLYMYVEHPGKHLQRNTPSGPLPIASHSRTEQLSLVLSKLRPMSRPPRALCPAHKSLCTWSVASWRYEGPDRCCLAGSGRRLSKY